MGLFGTGYYGDGGYYGEGSNTNLLWAFEVDWDEDDAYTGANEAVRILRMQSSRGRDYYISGSGNGFDPETIGQVLITVDNHDGRFDPYNTSSPFYGYIEPGKKCKLWLRNGIGGTDYKVITGIIGDIQLNGRNNEADIIIEDGWRWLNDRTVKVELQEDITADTAIEATLTAANWPAEWGSNLDTGPDTINYWWTENNAKREIENLSNSGLGNVFIAVDGSLTYYNRQKTDDPVLTLREEQLLKDVLMPQPWEFKRNIIEIDVHPRVLQSSQVIWTHNEIPEIPSGGSITLWAKYKYEGDFVPAKDVVTPVSTTDYTANTQADGGGSDITSDISVTITKYSNESKIVYSNVNASVAHLTLAQLRGKPISEPDTTAIIEEGTGSTTRPRRLYIDLPWQQSYNTGSSLAEVLADYMGDQQYFPTIYIEDRPSIQFGLELYDKVSLQLETWGIDTNFRIGKISHKFLRDTGQLVRTEIKLFPYYIPPVETYWYLGTAGKSELGATTYLGF